MTPFAVVEDLDVFEEVSMRGLVVEPATVMSQLGLEQMKERFGYGVIPAVALAAHALHETVSGQPLGELSAGVLDASIGVDDEPWRWLSSRHRSLQRRQHHGVIQRRTQRPADHTSRIQVDEDRQIQPATTDSKLGVG